MQHKPSGTQGPLKRLLIVTYYWPPSSGSGVQRWLKFAKHLPRHGWQPVVYTPANPHFSLRDESLLSNIPEACEVIKRPIWEPYSIYAKLTGKSGDNAGIGPSGPLAPIMRWIRGTLFVPDPRRLWAGPSVRFLSDYLERHPVDAMVTTGPPHSMHLIGLGLKRRLPDLPWLADMRDPWATFDIHAEFMNARARDKNRKLEASVLEACDRVILTSPGTRAEFPAAREAAVRIIPNGYDPDDFESVSPSPAADPGEFRVVHSGLLNAVRDVPEFWRECGAMVREDPAFARALRLELIGNVDAEMSGRLKGDPDLGPAVRVHPWMSHGELLEHNAGASVFLVIVNQSENARSQLPGKIFEYLYFRKPILALCPPDSALADLIRSTKAGIAVDASNRVEMGRALAKLWEEHRAGSPRVTPAEAIEPFSRAALTRKLVTVLEDVSSGVPAKK